MALVFRVTSSKPFFAECLTFAMNPKASLKSLHKRCIEFVTQVTVLDYMLDKIILQLSAGAQFDIKNPWSWA